jgi:hypothetical protein
VRVSPFVAVGRSACRQTTVEKRMPRRAPEVDRAGATTRFVERQEAARLTRQERNTELRPSSHRYSSPALPAGGRSAPRTGQGSGGGGGGGSSSSGGGGYSARHAPNGGGGSGGKNGFGTAVGWDGSTQTYNRARPAPLRRFAKGLDEKYRLNEEARLRASLDSVVIDEDFRPGVAAVLQAFKARCRNRARDTTIHEVWSKIDADAPLPDDEDDEEAADGQGADGDDYGTGSSRWIQRQRVARQEHERVAKQLALRQATEEKVCGSGGRDARSRVVWEA